MVDYLLDTNAAIPLLNGDPVMKKMVSEADEIFIPVIVIGELYFGAENSGQVVTNIQRVDDFAARYAVLHCDVATARKYGTIEKQLKMTGRRIPENDMWVAAIALQHKLTLLTRDAHFKHVGGLAIQAW
jgi:tRNA(fMet)-specific endonuclease VapC